MWEDRKCWTDAERFGAEVRHVSLSKYLGHAVCHFGFSKPSCQQQAQEEEIRLGTDEFRLKIFCLFSISTGKENYMHYFFPYCSTQNLSVCLKIISMDIWLHLDKS